MALWIELFSAFRETTERVRGKDEIQPFYDYARCCLYTSRDKDVQTAAALAFFQHLPPDPVIRKEIPRFLQSSEMTNSKMS